MSNLNRFNALMYSDDEEDVRVAAPKAAPAPAPAPKKKDNRGNNNKGGRGRGRGRNDRRGDRDRNDRRGGNRGPRAGRGAPRRYNPKADRRDHRRRDDRDRQERRDGGHRTRQPRNGPSDRRHGRDPRKDGHGSHGAIGSLAQETSDGVAQVRQDGDNNNEEVPDVPEVEPEPEETGLTLAEYNAKVLADQRKRLAALTGPPKAVRKGEQIDGQLISQKKAGAVRSVSKKAGISKKKKKGFVSADKFFSTKPREEPRGDDRGDRRGRDRDRGDRRGGDRDRRGDRRDDRRGGDRRRDDRRNNGSSNAPININDPNAFPTLG